MYFFSTDSVFPVPWATVLPTDLRDWNNDNVKIMSILWSRPQHQSGQ